MSTHPAKTHTAIGKTIQISEIDAVPNRREHTRKTAISPAYPITTMAPIRYR